MSGALQAVFQNQRSFGEPAPTVIGQSYGGGYYAGKIAVGGGGTATHYLVVAPKASGEASNKIWGPGGVTGITSTINGSTNSAAIAALGSSYEAATYCEGLSIGGFTDWYLPARDELEVAFFFLKNTTGNNDVNSGSNAYAVSPEPISTNYSTGTPAQTSVSIFQDGNSEAFMSGNGGSYYTSTEYTSSEAWAQYFTSSSPASGRQNPEFNKGFATAAVRAFRKVAI
jgi:hypothetical protein